MLDESSHLTLLECDGKLQELCYEVSQYIPFKVICGHRSEVEQNAAKAAGTSTQAWPTSKHNAYPALAVDVIPLPLDWQDHAAFARLYGHFERVAKEKGIAIRWGGDWNGNYRTKDEKLVDLGHIELTNPPEEVILARTA